MKLTVLIPCYNEEKALGHVIDGFPKDLLERNGFELDILVIDNNSTDNTAQVALDHGARVICETKKGKGNAMLTGMYSISDDTSYVVMLDGDNTYKSREVMRLLEPLSSNFCDVIIGSRLSGKIAKNSMKFTNRLGNWLFSFFVRYLYAANITDVLSGYFAWNYAVIKKLRDQLTTNDFRIEMEMITKMARMGYSIYSVPITYDERIGNSHLSIFHDGRLILGEFIKNLSWKPMKEVTKRLRIAFVCDAVYPYNKGGKEKRLYEVTTRLAQKGHDVHIYCMKWWDGPERIKTENGIHLHAICDYVPLYKNGRRSIKQALVFAFSCFKLLGEQFDIAEVDHMPHFPTLSMALVCLIKRKQMFITWHEVWGQKYWISYMGWKGVLGSYIERLSVILPFQIISVSVHTTQRIKDEFRIEGRVTTIPIGIDTQRMDTILPSQEKFDVVYAGRLLSHKHVDQLVLALQVLKQKLPDVRALIIGEGPDKEDLVRLSHDLGLEENITFMDFFEDASEVYSYVKSAKSFVLPSTREGFGISILEANACGTPVVVINHPENAAKDLVKQGLNGYICNLDPQEIADAIYQEATADSMADACRAQVKEYEWNHVLESIENAYHR